MVFGLSDVKVLLEFVEQARSWVGQVIARRKDEKEQQQRDSWLQPPSSWPPCAA